MAWRFQPGEGLDAAFRRVAAEEVGYVRGMLAASDCDREKAVHQTRRNFKRLRALLRLAKPSLGSAYSKENRRWRDAGRLLSATRDAHVLMQTLDAVLARCADGLTAQEGDDMRRRLRAKTGASDRSADAVERDIETVVGMVEAAEKEAGKLAWPRDVDELRRGLKRSQSRLKQRWKAARKHPEAEENLHEWRKCVKDHAAQMGLFREVLPHELKACRKDARDLAEILGEEHDLDVLTGQLGKLRLPAAAKRVRETLMSQIRERRDVLRAAAFEKGEALSSRRPKAFADEVATLWHKAEKGADAAAASL